MMTYRYRELNKYSAKAIEGSDKNEYLHNGCINTLMCHSDKQQANRIETEAMLIVAINTNGYHSEIKNVKTKNGMTLIENLIPDSIKKEALKSVESELYNVFSKYKKTLDISE
jgi:hypothetical protein